MANELTQSPNLLMTRQPVCEEGAWKGALCRSRGYCIPAERNAAMMSRSSMLTQRL